MRVIVNVDKLHEHFGNDEMFTYKNIRHEFQLRDGFKNSKREEVV